MDKATHIIAFYEFKDMTSLGPLDQLREGLRDVFGDTGVRGTLILADEGFNGMVCGDPDQIDAFIAAAGERLETELKFKRSQNGWAPFRKIDVKIKPEIVTLKQPVDIALGEGTHVDAKSWNALISDPETLILDARNDYEYQTGSFHGAINPGTAKFSELPHFIENNLEVGEHKRIAMFCTGGIRCEKFAPYLKGLGFEQVYQLDGGILKYLEEVSAGESLWEGECFVFDERVTVDAGLKKGDRPDLSQRHK